MTYKSRISFVYCMYGENRFFNSTQNQRQSGGENHVHRQVGGQCTAAPSFTRVKGHIYTTTNMLLFFFIVMEPGRNLVPTKLFFLMPYTL